MNLYLQYYELIIKSSNEYRISIQITKYNTNVLSHKTVYHEAK